MENIVIKHTLSVRREHEVLENLESAGLNDLIAEKIISSKENQMAKQLIQKAEEIIIENSVFKVTPVTCLENLKPRQEFVFLSPHITEEEKYSSSTRQFKIQPDSIDEGEIDLRLIFCTRKSLGYLLRKDKLRLVSAGYLVGLGIQYPDTARVCNHIMSLHPSCYLESDIDKNLKRDAKRGKEFLTIQYHTVYSDPILADVAPNPGPTLTFVREKDADYNKVWFAVTKL